jgi:hypothetical protein
VSLALGKGSRRDRDHPKGMTVSDPRLPSIEAMTVRELIELLCALDPDSELEVSADVYFQNPFRHPYQDRQVDSLRGDNFAVSVFASDGSGSPALIVSGTVDEDSALISDDPLPN